ncbi:putative defense protein 3 [Physella acuta]|uniref:putative defense protein 3 n=1 Tax=Physella acuta TaxID=109671 RepID=UPI0027DB4C6A|nr:putative defense protein 3 [Physella acuta]
MVCDIQLMMAADHPHTQTFLAVFVLTITSRTVLSSHNGQNVDDACQDLTPRHGEAPQPSPPLYKLTFSPNSYKPGQQVYVTVSTCNPESTGFKGFMVQARRADVRQDQTELLGGFTPVDNTRLACDDRALVHSDKTLKKIKSFNWTSPSQSVGHVVFRVTFVYSFTVFWSNIVSDVLLDAGLTDQVNLVTKTQLDSTCYTETCEKKSCSSGQALMTHPCVVMSCLLFTLAPSWTRWLEVPRVAI